MRMLRLNSVIISQTRQESDARMPLSERNAKMGKLENMISSLKHYTCVNTVQHTEF